MPIPKSCNSNLPKTKRYGAEEPTINNFYELSMLILETLRNWRKLKHKHKGVNLKKKKII